VQWAEELFVRMDRTGDGKVDRAEIKAFLDGTIEGAEKTQNIKVPRRMMVASSQWGEQLAAVQAKLETCGESGLDWAAFSEIVLGERSANSSPGVQSDVCPTAVTLPWVRELFVRMDTNGDGCLKRPELVKYLQGDEEAAKMFKLPPKFILGSEQHAQFESVYAKIAGSTEGDVTWEGLCEYFGFSAPATEAGIEEADNDLEAIMERTKLGGRPASVLFPHLPPSDGVPRCETPALQTRTMTPILSELEFKEGGWKDKLCGKNRVEYRSGNVYDGEWGWGDFHGKGRLEEADGCAYEGEWFEGKRNGTGKQQWADGASFEGTWVDDVRCGTGVHVNANGDRYDGQWKDNKRNGKGKAEYSTGNKYNGEWNDNNKEGTGQMEWKDGDKYEGQWAEDKMHGSGVFTSKDGKAFRGIYHKGKFVKRSMDRETLLGPRAATPGCAPYGMKT